VSRIDKRDYAVVNVHTFENIDRAHFISRTTNFDRETLESRLDRRKQ
jgi:hypothetical protein